MGGEGGGNQETINNANQEIAPQNGSALAAARGAWDGRRAQIEKQSKTSKSQNRERTRRSEWRSKRDSGGSAARFASARTTPTQSVWVFASRQLKSRPKT